MQTCMGTSALAGARAGARAGVRDCKQCEPRILRLEQEPLTDDQAAALESESPDESWYDVLIEGCNTEVYKPDGTPLVKLCAAAVPADIGKSAFEVIHSTHLQTSNNRGSAMGKTFKRPYIKATDGRLSRTVQSCNPITSKTLKLDSSIAGYFDRNARYRFCRETSLLVNQPDRWVALQPYIKEVDRIYRGSMPGRYQIQRAWADNTAQDFVINGTAFTTVTINKSWATAVHQDAGDLKQGFGVITCLKAGAYRGGHLVFPKWRIAVNLQSCDVLMFDPHEWHGNTKIVGRKDAYQRITCVFYYRKNMIMAGDAAHELRQAQNKAPGQPIWSDQEKAKLADFEARYPVP